MALMKGNKNSDNDKRHLRIEEGRTAGLLNVVVAVAVAAVAYTDWIVVANVSMGYLYILPIALSALCNRLAHHHRVGRPLYHLAGDLWPLIRHPSRQGHSHPD